MVRSCSTPFAGSRVRPVHFASRCHHVLEERFHERLRDRLLTVGAHDPGSHPLRAAPGPGAATSAPTGKPRNRGTPFSDEIAIDSLERRDFGGRHTTCGRGIGRTLRQIGGRIEAALARIGQQTVGRSVQRVALFVDFRGNHRDFFMQRGRRPQRLADTDVVQHRPGKIEDGGADDDAVEVLGEALCGNQPLPPAGGTAVEVRAFRRGPVVGARQLLGRQRRHVDRAVGIVDQLLWARGKGRQRLTRSIVAGVRRHHGEAGRECGIAPHGAGG